MSGLSPDAVEKIAKLIPLLGSRNTGEAAGAGYGIERIAAGEGSDLHDVAEMMRRAGQHRPQPAHEAPPRSTGGRGWSTDFDPRPSWERKLDPYRDAVRACQAAADRLTEWERSFISSIGPRVVHGLSLSTRQQASLMSIVARLNS